MAKNRFLIYFPHNKGKLTWPTQMIQIGSIESKKSICATEAEIRIESEWIYMWKDYVLVLLNSKPASLSQNDNNGDVSLITFSVNNNVMSYFNYRKLFKGYFFRHQKLGQ